MSDIGLTQATDGHDARIGLRFVGHVLIRDGETREVLRDCFNSIHLENMSEAMALALADRSAGHIQSMVFGNGGSIVSAVGAVTYLPPNASGAGAALYNQTYAKVVDDMSPLNPDPAANNLRVKHTLGTFYSDVVVTCTLTTSEPSGQSAFDDAPVAGGSGADPAGTYIFDELGLASLDPATGGTKLLSHVVFHPVQKALNRSIEVVYTVRVVLS